jgi:hypothetical protein
VFFAAHFEHREKSKISPQKACFYHNLLSLKALLYGEFVADQLSPGVFFYGIKRKRAIYSA